MDFRTVSYLSLKLQCLGQFSGRCLYSVNICSVKNSWTDGEIQSGPGKKCIALMKTSELQKKFGLLFVRLFAFSCLHSQHRAQVRTWRSEILKILRSRPVHVLNKWATQVPQEIWLLIWILTKNNDSYLPALFKYLSHVSFPITFVWFESFPVYYGGGGVYGVQMTHSRSRLWCKGSTLLRSVDDCLIQMVSQVSHYIATSQISL